jgi:thioredoxin-like negative regulator of GroEL
MEQVEGFCNGCQSNQIHTFRLYEQKTKHYSVLAIGANHTISAICHGCLLESAIPKNEEKLLIRKYKKEIICWEGFDLLQNQKIDNATKKFRKVLKKDPDHPQALYGLAKSLVSQGKFDEARVYVDNLSVRFSEDDSVKELKAILARNTQ